MDMLPMIVLAKYHILQIGTNIRDSYQALNVSNARVFDYNLRNFMNNYHELLLDL